MLTEFKSLMKWIQDPHEDWRKPVILTAILALFISILTTLFISAYSFIFLVTPDFSITANPPVSDYIDGIGPGTANITLKNIHNIFGIHSYRHPISLTVSEASPLLDITFDPPSFRFEDESDFAVVMQYSSERFIGLGTHNIKIIAKGADGLERSCDLYLVVK